VRRAKGVWQVEALKDEEDLCRRCRMVAPRQEAYHYPAVKANPPEQRVHISVRILFSAKPIILALSGWATAARRRARPQISVSLPSEAGHRYYESRNRKPVIVKMRLRK